MVGQVVVLCDLLPILIVIIVLLVIFFSDILVRFLTNQKINILTFVGNGRSLLLLTILLIGKLITVTLQIAFRQELQALGIHVPPIARIRLETHVRFHHAIGNRERPAE
jgi:hypothetical protein